MSDPSPMDYLEKLILEMDRLGITRVCLSGLGDFFQSASNEDVKAAMEQYPDRIIGAFFIRPGMNSPADIQKAQAAGFQMLKVSLPRGPYDDPSYHPLWREAQELHMPILFHTGVVTTLAGPGEDVSAWNMHPMRLESVSREFPDLGLIIAHLGIHWNHDAAEIARMRPNVFVDLTGEPTGWRVRVEREGFDKYLWWPDAFDKVVFGTDVWYTKIATILDEDRNRLERLNIPAGTQERVFYKNIKKLLGEA